MELSYISFPAFKDERGTLVAIESSKEIPFEIKRIYYILGTQRKDPRGFHAHKDLHQVIVCLKGSCLLTLDDGVKKKKIHLNNPTQGVSIDRMIWHEMHDLSDDCLLLVLASDYFQETDYIRDYEEFKRLIKNRKLCC
ncbi:sugar 3,4-ketoisomerase [Cytobacillus praedii]|uniref:sugar 3,4-ketoisomerase n=1 Tax=Cytobacillus praedii TaxID=1742358 RepID=UPI003AF57BDC